MNILIPELPMKKINYNEINLDGILMLGEKYDKENQDNLIRNIIFFVEDVENMIDLTLEYDIGRKIIYDSEPILNYCDNNNYFKKEELGGEPGKRFGRIYYDIINYNYDNIRTDKTYKLVIDELLGVKNYFSWWASNIVRSLDIQFLRKINND